MFDLHTIIYVSSANHLFPNHELQELLHSARENNRRVGVTGVLLYNDGNFMQCIEGPKKELFELYEKIGKSTRHHGIIELVNESIEEREFGDWDMGFALANAPEFLSIAGMKSPADTARSLAGPGNGQARMLLKAFWMRVHHRGA